MRRSPPASGRPEARPGPIIVDGLAKTYAMTGWRVGWSIAPRRSAAGIAKLQTQLCSNVNNVAQAAALEALTGPQDAGRADARGVRPPSATTRGRGCSRAIDGLEVVEPEGAFYVYPSVAGLMGRDIAGVTVTTSLELADLLLDEGEGRGRPRRGLRLEASFRLSYALSDADLEEGIGAHRGR
jgi:aspartate aminotransferase